MSFHNVVRIGAALSLLACPSPSASAQSKPQPKTATSAPSPWVPSAPFATPAAELLAMPVTRNSSTGGADIVFASMLVRIDRSGLRSWRTHSIIRVFSQQGAQAWSEINGTYDPTYEQKPTIKARVITQDGREHWLDPSILSEQGLHGDETYSTRRRLRGPLPAVAPGTVLEIVADSSEHHPALEAGLRGREYLYQPARVHLERLIFDIDRDLPFQYEVRGVALKPKSDTITSGRRQLLFELRDQLPFAEAPPAAPPDVAPMPVVEYGVARSWQEVAAAYSKLVDRQIAGFDALAAARNVVGSATEAREKAKSLLAFVQTNVRYVALELGDRSVIPAPPGQVLNQGFGDCKDKATLLVALLRSVSVPADVALLKAGPGLDLSPRVQGFGSFNHVIVRVSGKDGFWIDPSTKYTEVGILPVEDQNRYALVARADSTQLMQTPLSPVARDILTDTWEFTYPDLGAATARETTTGSGTYAILLRRQTDATDVQLKQQLSGYVRKFLAAEIDSVQTTASEAELKLVVQTGPVKQARTTDDGISHLLNASLLLTGLPKALIKPRVSVEEAAREQVIDPLTRPPPALPLALVPGTRSGVYQLSAPADFVWDELPSDIDLRSGPLRMQRQSTRTANGIRVAYTLTIDSPRLETSQIEKAHSAILEFLDTSRVRARASYGPTRLRQSGDFLGSVKLHRERIAQAKQKANAMRRFANDLLEMGLVLPARRIAEAALAADPKLAWTHFLVGALAARDDLGRWLRPGADLERARKAYARAAELAPSEETIQARYATTLLLGLDRVPFGKAVEIEHARDLLMTLRSKENTSAYDSQIVESFFHQRRFREAIRFAESLKETDLRLRGYWLASIALDQGVEAAGAKAAQLDGSNVPELLLGTVGGLMALGDFDRASQVAGLPAVAKRLTARHNELAKITDVTACKSRLHPAASAVLELETAVMSGQKTPEQALSELKRNAGGGYLDLVGLRARFDALVLGDGSRGDLQETIARYTCLSNWQVEESQDVALIKLSKRVGDKPYARYLLRKRNNRYHWVAYTYRTGGVDFARPMREDLLAHRIDAAQQWSEWWHEMIKDEGGKRDEYAFADCVNDAWQSSRKASDRESLLWLMVGCFAGEVDKTDATVRKVQEARARFADDQSLAFAAELAIADWHRWYKPKESLELYRALRSARPRDRTVRKRYIAALERSHEYGEALDEARAMATEHPDDGFGYLLHVETETGKYEQAKRDTQVRLAQGKADIWDLNNVAWNALFQNADLSEAVGLAEEAARKSERKNPAVLHTLAALYADAGRPERALSTVRELEALEPVYPPNPANWYVYGRVAEDLGFPEDARAYYSRCHEPERDFVDPLPPDSQHDTSVQHLAQLRFSRLGTQRAK
jgi:transglutaminase-like putative cysteine protease/tetratricopeptide (TPR) repeat protein